MEQDECRQPDSAECQKTTAASGRVQRSVDSVGRARLVAGLSILLPRSGRFRPFRYGQIKSGDGGLSHSR
jgi:hypothetical protein